MLKSLVALLLFYSLFSDQYGLSIGNPMKGPNVKLAKFNAFPFIVSIGRKLNNIEANKHFCTGALISLKLVITSEHCMENEIIDDIRVNIGSNHLNFGVIYNVTSVITYQSWSINHNEVPLQDNDVAILKLSKTVTVPGVKPAAITKETDDSAFYEKTVVVAGWGAAHNCHLFSMNLQTASVKVLSASTCANNIFLYNGEIVEHLGGLLCTKADPFVMLGCGDSGGPLLLDNEIIGINESCYPDRSDGQNLHTSITYYAEFIEDVLKNQ